MLKKDQRKEVIVAEKSTEQGRIRINGERGGRRVSEDEERVESK